MPCSERLPKSERIHSERHIDALFAGGRRGSVEPLKYCWIAARYTSAVSTQGSVSEVSSPLSDTHPDVLPTADTHPDVLLTAADSPPLPSVSILFSVPKKAFKRAWKRNLIKRRLRESYRRRKHLLTECETLAGKHLDIALICSPSFEKGSVPSIPDFKTIDNAVSKILEQILVRS